MAEAHQKPAQRTNRFRTVGLLSLVVLAATCPAWAQGPCDGQTPPNRVCSKYSGSVTLADGGKRCITNDPKPKSVLFPAYN